MQSGAESLFVVNLHCVARVLAQFQGDGEVCISVFAVESIAPDSFIRTAITRGWRVSFQIFHRISVASFGNQVDVPRGRRLESVEVHMIVVRRCDDVSNGSFLILEAPETVKRRRSYRDVFERSKW